MLSAFATSMTEDISSEKSSASTVKENDLSGDQTIDESKETVLSHESSTGSLVHNLKMKLEPSRFPSLTFISNTNLDRETSIKNANLKSEMIENNTKPNKKSKDSLFNLTAIPSAASNTSNNFNNYNTTFASSNHGQNGLSSVRTSESTSTLQTVYADAYSSLDSEEGRSNILSGALPINHSDYDDSHSVYQQSIHSIYQDNVLSQRTNQNNGYTQNMKEDTESFIYHDLNPIDISSINDHKGQRKVSNNVFLSNPFAKENQIILSQSQNSEFDFLDNQSISTVVTVSDGHYFYGARSPVNKRNSFQQNISVSPTHSKVRQVSQKIFQNNPNYSGSNNYSKIKVGKRNHTYNEFRGQNEDIYEDSDEDINESTGLTDAESFLAQPFKTKKKIRNKYASMQNLSIKKGYGSIHDEIYDHIEDFDNVSNMGNSSPHDYKSMYYRQNYMLNFLLSSIYVFVTLLLTISFLKIVLIQNFDIPLSKFEVDTLENVLISDEILLLDIKSQAINLNFQDVEIWNMDLDVFLVTDEVNLSFNPTASIATDVTILMGSTSRFLTPFHYSGSLHLPKWKNVWNTWRNPDMVKPNKSISQLKIYKPGQHFEYQGHKLTSDQWTMILNSPYKIILRGNLKYSLPLSWQDQFISLSTEIEIFPNNYLQF